VEEREILDMVRMHHERYDGKGYPDGISGDRIPLGARIMALADAYDAMTSDRPYRKSLGMAVAIEEIKKGAGTQFAPDVVEAFLRIEKSIAPDNIDS
jgi:HD-GYP domain-containing protein (c-di-GMP phosphodiesterase class II)